MYKSFITIISNNFNSSEYLSLKRDLIEKGFETADEFPNSNWEAPVEYKQEMGNNLETRVLILKAKLDKEGLELLKEYLIELEMKYSDSGKRRFNINPGFLAQEGMFLLSHKPSSERRRVFW